MYTCKNIGCHMTFKYRSQRIRHLEKCNKEKVKEKIKFISVEDKFQCLECNRTYKYKEGYYRHLRMKTCTRKKQYEYKCDICQKIFQYKCRLEAHRKRCMQIKHRINHDDEYAIEFSQNEFVPSFVSPYNESSDCHAEDITSKCNYKKKVEIEPSDFHVEDVNTDSTNNVEIEFSDCYAELVDTNCTNNVEIDSTNDGISSNDCWRVYKSNQRTRKKIDDVINQLNYIHIGRLNNNENTSSLNQIVAYVSVDSVR